MIGARPPALSQPPALLYDRPMSDPRQPATPPQRDPRDGAQPPELPTDTPANPIAVAQLLSGGADVTQANIAAILGAPVAQLLRDKRSILYGKARAPGATPAKRPAGDVGRPGEVVVLQGSSTPGEVVVLQGSSKVGTKSPPPVSTKGPGQPFLARLQLLGVGCAEWVRMTTLDRGRLLRHVFYDANRPGLPGDAFQLPPLPKNPDDLIPAIDEACGAASAPASGKTPQAAANGGARAVDWFLSELLHRGGVDCAVWASMSGVARLNTVRNFFYSRETAATTTTTITKQLLAAQRDAVQRQLHGAPERPEELVEAIDNACQAPRAVAIVASPSSQPSLAQWARDAWAALRAMGVTCDQWIAMPNEQQRWTMLQSLWAQNRLPRFYGAHSAWDLFLALDLACYNRVEPAESATASVLRRLRAILNCAQLNAQDKVQQIQTIQSAFPELNQDRRALYRLALARYDLCNPAPQPGWNGEGLLGLTNHQQIIQELAERGGYDILGGNTQGMSIVQWVKQGPYMASGHPDVTDPVQGSVGDCYFIAAMSSVAWVNPGAISRNGQPRGEDRRSFDLGNVRIDTSERTASRILSGFLPVFARGRRLDHQWPGVMEKAYALLRVGGNNDRPPVPALANSSMDVFNAINGSLAAIPLLAGGTPFWFLTYFRTADELFDLLARYCTPQGRARVPMIATTYREDGFVDRTGLAPNHAYSVLGFGFSGASKFVVLRNPWGSSWAGLPHAGFRVPIAGRWFGMSLDGGDGGCFALAHGAFSAAFSTFYGAQ
jgi:hypothetical protein